MPAALARLTVFPVVIVAALVAALTNARAEPPPPRVVASIVPVHAIVAAVMEGVAAPHLLVTGGASPHGYTLRPSDARRLAEADLVFWVSETMEAFLKKPISALGPGSRVVTLLDLDGLTRLPARAGGAWTGDHGAAGSAHGDADTHVWLDPANAKVIAGAAAAALGAVDPERRATYAANARLLAARLDALDAELAALLAPVREVPYVVFHDAYRYFERRYRLGAVAAVTVGPGRSPGARRLKEIRAYIGETGARCLFSEPQFAPALVRTVAEGTGARVGVLDPLGADLAPGAQAYFTLMRRLARDLRDCLTADG